MKELFDIAPAGLGCGIDSLAWGNRGAVLSALGSNCHISLVSKDGKAMDVFSLSDSNSTAQQASGRLQWSHAGAQLLPTLCVLALQRRCSA